jgi:hypothetical protein
MYRYLLGTPFVVIILALIVSLCFAQEGQKDIQQSPISTIPNILQEISKMSKNEQFQILKSKRDNLYLEIFQLESELNSLQQEISYIKNEITSMNNNSSYLTDLKSNLDKYQRNGGKDKDKLKDFQDRINEFQGYVNDSKQKIGQRDVNVLEHKLAYDKSLIEVKKMEKRRVETAFDSLFNYESAKQEFNTSISRLFAGLVGIVIVGFFLIAYLDCKVRQAVFSGQSGIQFITLFSLVIAIILFGITGVLEGKELSALLGGLSGYILGRVTQPRETSPPPTSPQPPTPPST